MSRNLNGNMQGLFGSVGGSKVHPGPWLSICLGHIAMKRRIWKKFKLPTIICIFMNIFGWP
jgi:hypothetical protein